MNSDTDSFIKNKELNNWFNEHVKCKNPTKAIVKPKKLEAIGLIIIKFQRLESTIKLFIQFLTELDQKLSQILTCELTFKNSLFILLAISEYKKLSINNDLKMLINACFSAEQIRNQIVHSIWTSGPRLKMGCKSKNGFNFKSENYTAEDLESIANQIDKLDTCVNEIKFEYIQDAIDNDQTPKEVRII